MNYRHHFHAGNFADVMKHALFVRLIRGMQKKEKGFLLVDTHAGRGAYDLAAAATGTTLARAPEWPEGIGRLWDRTGLDPLVNDYLAQVRQFDANRGGSGALPRHYPGSPLIARALLRPQDRLFLYERHPEEREALAQQLVFEKVRIETDDGYRAAAALLPPPERRALLLIDPPFEEATEWESIAGCVATALKRLPAAVIAVWYPITARADRRSFLTYWQGEALPPTLALELEIDPNALGMRGSGLIVFNPPWGFAQEAQTILEALKAILAKSSEAKASASWPVPERP